MHRKRSSALRPLAAAFPALFAAAALPAQGDPACASLPLDGHRVVETRANTFDYNRQMDPSLDVDEEGRLLVAWASRLQEHGTSGVFAQLFDPLGRPLGTEIHVNQTMAGGQTEPAVAFGPEGSAWIAWSSGPGQDGSRSGVYLRRLAHRQVEDASGSPAGRFEPVSGEILVNQTTVADQLDPTVMVDGDGDVWVAWVSSHLQHPAVYARCFDPFGSPLGGEFRLSDRDTGREGAPVLALLDGKRVAAAWSLSTRDGRPEGVYARIFDAQGAAAGPSFALHEQDGRQHVEPSLDADACGRLVAAWMSAGDDAQWQVSVRRFDRDGAPLGPALALNNESGEVRNGATVAAAPDGRFLVAYNVQEGKRHGGGNLPVRLVSIAGQMFGADGALLGAASRLHQIDEGEQSMPAGLNARHLRWSRLDQIALAWNGQTQDDQHGVGLTLLVPEEMQAAAPPLVEPRAALVSREEFYAQQELAPPVKDPNWAPDPHTPKPPPRGPDFGFEAFQSTIWTPPDPDLAVGPNHVVVVVNVAMRIFDKAGNMSFESNLEPFFNTTGFVFDPVALYDESVDRYVIAAVEHRGSLDYFLMAVSDDNDPNGTWYKYEFNVDTLCGFIDFPNLGVGADAYYLNTDCFSTPGGNKIHVVRKAPMLNGSPTTRNSLVTSASFISLGSTRNYDAASPAHYEISAFSAGSPFLQLFAVVNPTTTPSFSTFNLNVGAFSTPPDAQQLGSSFGVDTIDVRTKNGVVRNGVLYATHNVSGGDGASKVRWYKIDLRGWPSSGNTPTLLDSGMVNPGTNIDTWFGDVNVDAAGNMAIAYNRSSPSEYVGIHRTFHAVGDPAGTVRPGVEMQTSTSPDTSGRWGDYSGVEEDPTAAGVFWCHLEYRTSTWRTWVGRFDVTGSNTDLIRLIGPTLAFPLATVTWTWSGGPPNDPWYFLWSRNGNGSTLMGHDFDLGLPITQAATGNHDGSGRGTYTATIPAAASGRTIYIEVGATSGTFLYDSNMLVMTVN